MRNSFVKDIEIMSVKDFMKRNYHYQIKHTVFLIAVVLLAITAFALAPKPVMTAFLYLR